MGLTYFFYFKLSTFTQPMIYQIDVNVSCWPGNEPKGSKMRLFVVDKYIIAKKT